MLINDPDGDDNKTAINKTLWRKYPKAPTRETEQWLENMFEN